MHTNSHALIGTAANVSIPSSKPIISFSPVVIPAPERLVQLELRVTIPATGSSLPIILFSHGHGRSNSLSSLEGYAPIVEFWAAHGFAVIQPTHLSSAFLGLKPPPGQELFYQERAKDMVRILDNLDLVETAVPGLSGRLDRNRVAVAGHSAGAWTATMLLGASNIDPRDGSKWYSPEPRIKAGVILAGVGNGGEDISEIGKTLLPFYGPTFGTINTPSLVVYGDEDVGPHLTVRGADWHADPYFSAKGEQSLLCLKGAKHGLGGISGWDAGETLDESPEILEVVRRLTWAYLWSQLYKDKEDKSWENVCKVFEGMVEQGKIESKN